MLLELTVKMALESPQIKAAQAALKAVNFDIDFAKSKRLPSVDIYSDAGYQAADNLNTRNNAGLSYNSERRVSDIRNGFQIKLTQPLFDGYNAKYNIEAKNNYAKAYEYELIKIKEQTALDAASAYVSVVFANKMYTAATLLLMKYRELMERSIRLYRADKMEAVYFFKIQELYNSIVAKEDALLFECRKADVAYKLAVGTFPPQSSSIREPEEPSACPKTKNGVYKLLLANNPSLLACKAYEKAAMRKVKAAQASFMPNINLELAKTWLKNADGSETNEDNEFALITLSYNLFNGGGDKALKNKAIELKKKARYEKERLISLIEGKADRLFANMFAAFSNKRAFVRLEETQKKLIKSYQKKDDYLDVMEAEGRMFETRIALLKAQKEYLSVQYVILAEGGRLLRFFNLN